MRVKEIKRTANVAWSPANQHPIYLAGGTAAQQLDATFSTTAALELYEVDVTDSSQELKVVASVDSECRFHKLVWGGGIDSASNGLLVGGADHGNIHVWDTAKMLNGGTAEEILVKKLDKHTGSVTALDFNPYQPGLLASGGSDSDIFIWDLNKDTDPLTPGSKSKPPDDVTCVAWNKQVQHILASTYAGRCVIWDLKKNEPIIKVSDSMSRIKCKQAAWHPDVATQICLASEDDHTPVVQVWDLRFATSPVKILENHQRGILSMAWCAQDSDLLITCGKDNRILCWNPNSMAQSGEVVYELPTSNQWSFDIQWCPRNPNMISNCSFDGQISVYSLLGGGLPPNTPTHKVSDSFPSDPFSQAAQSAAQPSGEVAPQMLKKPPKWLQRPVGASFGFGGKLIKFSEPASTDQQALSDVRRTVEISQVVTEPELLSRSQQLEEALSSGQYVKYCEQQIQNNPTVHGQTMWRFLKVHFESDPRNKYLELLGYDQNMLAQKVSNSTGSQVTASGHKGEVDAGELAKEMAKLDTSVSDESSSSLNVSHDSSAFDQIAQTADVKADDPLPIATGNDFQGLLSEALLLANFDAAVEVCIDNGRMAEAIILAIAGGPELLTRTQSRFFKSNSTSITRLISSVVCRDFEGIVRTCELENWREALAIILTYSKPEQFAELCDILGSRLEEQNYAQDALLCHVCAGNVDQLIRCLNKIEQDSPDTLQAMIEKVMLLRKANDIANNSSSSMSDLTSGPLADKLSQYAQMLASQGSMLTALNYLGSSNESNILVLRHRLTSALGNEIPGVPYVTAPFQCVDVRAEGAPQPAAVRATPQTSQAYGSQQTNQGYGGPQTSVYGGQGATQTSYGGQGSIGAQIQQRTRLHQSQAGLQSEPVTTTTPSSYYSPQPSYTAQPAPTMYAGQTSQAQPVPQPPTAQPVAQPTSQPGLHTQRGSLGRKYPAQPATSQQPTSYNPYQPQTTPAYQPNNPAMSQNTPQQGVQQPGVQQPGMDLNASHGSGGFPSMLPNTSQPSIFNPAASMQHTPGGSEEESPNSLQEKIKQLLPSSHSATELVKCVSPPPLSRRRSSKFQDRESIAADIGEHRRSSGERRHSVYSTETDTGAPIMNPPSSQHSPGPSGPMVTSFQDMAPKAAWNDPPMVSGGGKKKRHPSSDYVAPAPITQPIYGVTQPDQGPPGAPSYNGTMYNGNQNQQIPTSMAPQTQQYGTQPPQTQVAPQKPPTPAPPVEKAALPTEHQILQDILNKLTQQCLGATNNPQTKRKLEDVLRKLEFLYDKLREGRLSDSVTQYLHLITQHIQQYDYPGGLTRHSELISQGNFSEISSFMPSLKVLMQTANQMQVYVQ